MLCAEPWELNPKSRTFGFVRTAMTEAQVQWRLVAAEGGRADLDFGDGATVRVARRDRLLLALILLYHVPGGAMGPKWVPWCRELPKEAPPCFHQCRARFPVLWTPRRRPAPASQSSYA